MKLRVSVYDGSGALIGGELERKKRKAAKPLWSHADVEDLIDRLLKSAATTDEAPGHAFHGNQYVEVAGQKVVLPTKGSVKQKLHDLFAQGHQFTLKELAALLGETETTLRGRLSDIKKAAPAGGLILEKSATGHYTLKKKEAEAVEPYAGWAAEIKAEKEALAAKVAAYNKAQEESEAQFLAGNVSGPKMVPSPFTGEIVPAAPVPPPVPVPEPVAAPAPVAAPETKQTLAEKALPEPAHIVHPPEGGAMDKAQADNIYNQKLDAWMNTVQGAGFPKEQIEPETIKALAQGWKNTKANAMAEWAANTTGQPQKAKELGVFKADEQLVKDLISKKMSFPEVISAWKSNTQKEKAGTWPPDPFKAALEAEAKAKAAMAAEVAEKTKGSAIYEASLAHEPHFGVVDTYVPAGHLGIGPNDFATGDYKKNITELRSKLAAGHPDAIENKIGVQKALENRLAASPAFQALQTQMDTSGKYNGSLVANLISAWAGSSGDHQPKSVANQLAIRDAFGMKDSEIATTALHLITKSNTSEDEVYAQAADTLGCRYTTAAEKKTFRSGLRDFALAQYHSTQDHFKALGITEISVARGSAGDVGVHKSSDATYGLLKLQPASSFSANFSTANGFAKGDSLYMVKVPVSQVLSSYVTGFGCTNEHEVVVLAHPHTAAVRITANLDLPFASQHVASTLKGGPSMSSAALEKYEAAKAAKHAASEKQALIEAHVGGKAPVVPKPNKYTAKWAASPAYKSAKLGDVEGTKAAVKKYTDYITEKGYTAGNHTKAYMASIVQHAEHVGAHKEAVKKAKLELKVKAPKKQKKPTVHVHVHTEQTSKEKYAAAEKTWASSPTQATIAAALEPTPKWYAEHPMHNETKYKAMVLAGKTPIQIKHYYGSLKHAAEKKKKAADPTYYTQGGMSKSDVYVP